MNARVVLLVLLGLALAAPLSGCSEATSNRIQEPWTTSQRLEQERARSDSTAEELRERVAQTQIDR